MPPLIVGVDFAGPARATDQRKKIIAIAAELVDEGCYRVRTRDFNERIADYLLTQRSPGWSAHDLVNELATADCEIVAFDFPFSIPRALLRDEAFAKGVGHPRAFGTWSSFNSFVAETLGLTGDFNFAAFENWKTTAYWKKRRTDELALAQPPLKHQYQVLLNMTLVGATVLHALGQHYRVEPWLDGPKGAVIEVYPGFVMRKLGLVAYKGAPACAVALVQEFLGRNGITFELDDQICLFARTYNTARNTADFDGADALIALAMAIAFRENLLVQIFDGTEEEHLLEGAIWGPL